MLISQECSREIEPLWLIQLLASLLRLQVVEITEMEMLQQSIASRCFWRETLKCRLWPQVIGNQGELHWQITIWLPLIQAGCCAANEAELALARVKSDFVIIIPSTAHPWGSLTPLLNCTLPAQPGDTMALVHSRTPAVCAVPLLTQLDPWGCWR